MTLLLTLSSPWGICQSSDYRLTKLQGTTATHEDDIAGSKQLSVTSDSLVASVCFTGVAEVGGYKTRDWIAKIFGVAKQPLDIDLVGSEIAKRGTAAVSLLPASRKALTVVIAVARKGYSPRLLIISNVDQIGGPRRIQPAEDLSLFGLTSSRPDVLVLGYDAGVGRANKKFLERLVGPSCDFKLAMEGLAAVNMRVARDPLSRGFISEGCMVSALLPDGQFFSVNYGEVKGIPDNFLGGKNIGELLRRNLLGENVSIRQTAGRAVGSTNDAVVLSPEGEPRIIRFSNPSIAVKGIGNATGGEFDKLTIQGLEGSVAIKKNEPVSLVLANVHFEAGPTGPCPRNERELTIFPKFRIPSTPTIDGGQPRDWNYPFDILVDENVHTLRMRQLSTALRSANLAKPLLCLGATEELVVAAPKAGLTLSSKTGGMATGVIEAELLLRDFPELGPSVTSQSVSISFPLGSKPISIRSRKDGKVGRNDECPCGSGQKYKRCHGR